MAITLRYDNWLRSACEIRRYVLKQSLRSGPLEGAQNGIFCRLGYLLANAWRSSAGRNYSA